jgi:predicted nuclease with TOPRIM domain
MPPKKNKQKSSDSSIESAQESSDEKLNIAALPTGLEDLLDRRLRQQTEQINDLFLKFSKTTKTDLDQIKKSQDFLGSKFDGLAASINDLKNENKELRKHNAQLNQRVEVLEMQCTSAESEVENVKRYLRRDLLEIHRVPESRDKNTDTIVQTVVQLVAPELNLNQTDISISPRLPAAEGNIKPIIAKFTRRNTRDAIYKKK